MSQTGGEDHDVPGDAAFHQRDVDVASLGHFLVGDAEAVVLRLPDPCRAIDDDKGCDPLGVRRR